MYLFLPYRSLNKFGDAVLLRDPRGRSIYRSLHEVTEKVISRRKGTLRTREAGIAISGPFLLRQAFRVTKEQGLAFVNATGDENPIHREDDVVAGAMTGARAVSSLEALFPRLGISRLRVKFRSVARYGLLTRQHMSISFRGSGAVEIKVRIEQEGKEVAEGVVLGSLQPQIQRASVGKWRVNRDELRRVEEYFASLAIAPDLYLNAGNDRNYSYPRGYLASLPSGEMVRQLSGEGGFLTSLDLTFPEGPPPAITGSGRPEVSLETAKSRPTFWKILTLIKHNLEEHCKGFALVFTPTASLEG